jgi:heat-inducible transcriptional repressor
VGSKAIAQLAPIGLSPATIRNVMGALADKGLIEQPHTSAGRVPTDKGLRYYVDCLLHLQAPSDEEQKEIAARIGEAGDPDAALKEATRVLRRIARHTTVVVTRVEQARIKHLELLRLRDDAVLLIVVTAEGKVQNRLLEWRGDLASRAPDVEALERAGRRITALVEDKTFDEAREALAREIDARAGELAALERRLLSLSAEGLAKAPEGKGVHVEGTAHLLEEQASIERTKELLALLEEDRRVQTLLEQAARAPGVNIFIGEENPAQALAERGIVAAPLGPGGALGVLGVIGPRHLDYNRVVPLVDLTAEVVRRTLKR